MRTKIVALSIGLATLLTAGSALAGSIIKRLPDQMGVRVSSPVSANPKIGDKFQGVVVDAAKLSRHGFPNLKQGDKVTLKITGPNNQFELLPVSSPSQVKVFHFDAQGAIQPGAHIAAPIKH